MPRSGNATSVQPDCQREHPRFVPARVGPNHRGGEIPTCGHTGEFAAPYVWLTADRSLNHTIAPDDAIGVRHLQASPPTEVCDPTPADDPALLGPWEHHCGKAATDRTSPDGARPRRRDGGKMFEFLRQVNAAHHGDGGVRSDDGDPGYNSGEGQPRLREQWGWTHGRDPPSSRAAHSSLACGYHGRWSWHNVEQPDAHPINSREHLRRRGLPLTRRQVFELAADRMNPPHGSLSVVNSRDGAVVDNDLHLALVVLDA